MAYLRMVTGQELCQRIVSYFSWQKLHHCFVRHIALLSVAMSILLVGFCIVWHEKNCRDSSECMMLRELQAYSLDAAPLNFTALKRNQLSAEVVRRVESFIIFLGMEDRIFGQMVSHHPEVAIAINFNLFQRWKVQTTILHNKSLLLTSIVANATSQNPDLLKDLKSSSQKLTVVGDYSAFNLTQLCVTSPLYCYHVCTQLQEVLRIPVKFIQLVANPYDSISAVTLQSMKQAHKTFSSNFESTQITNEKSILSDSIDAYFHTARQLMVFKQQSRVPIHYVHWHDLQQDTAGTLQKLCDFLNIACTAKYIDVMHEYIALIKFHRPRSKVAWTDDLIATVERYMTDIPWIQRYRYDSDTIDFL